LTVAASFSFLTPRGGALVVLAVLPVASLAVGARRVERARRLLRLPAPPAAGRVRRVVYLTALVGLLAVAAMQPVVRTQTSLRARTDAQAFVVVDVSRSMAAAPAPARRSRLARARSEALALAPQFGDVPVGLATLTDRVLPDLFPTSDRAAFDSTVSSLVVEDPPPREVSTVATTYDALRSVATQGFFAPSAKKRAIVLITDGESRPFDPAGVAVTLRAHGIGLAVIRVGGGADRVWRTDGKPEANFRPDPHAAVLNVRRLAAAAQVPPGRSSVAVVARALGSGPSTVVGVQPRTRALAPVPALVALLPLALLLGAGAAREQLRGLTSLRHVPETREGAA
jgi:hypothetical protein